MSVRTVLSARVGPLAIAGLLLVASAMLRWLDPALRAPLAADWLPWALPLGVTFLVAESTQLHLEFRRQTHSISVSEIPLVLALFLVAPATAVVVRLAAAAVLMAAQRRPVLKAAFNLCLLLLETLVAYALFLAWSRPDVTNAASWLAVMGAVAIAVLLSHSVVLTVIAVSESRLPGREVVVGILAPAVGALLLNTAVALVALLAVRVDQLAVALLVLLGAALLLAYRGYSRSLREHVDLGRVYRFSRVLEQVRGLDGPLEEALDEARETLNAALVRLVLLGPDGQPGTVTEVAADGAVSARAVDDTADGIAAGELAGDEIARRALASRGGILLDRHAPAPSLAALARRGARELVAVPLRAGSEVRGHLEVQDRRGEMTSFSPADVRLVENLVAHLTAAVENQRLVGQLRHAAYHDRLTGLPNRSRLVLVLDAEIAAPALSAADGTPAAAAQVGLVQLDVDRFKEINDSLGHGWGDQLLVLIGRRLAERAGPGATVARLGADEFAVVRRVAHPVDAERWARELRTAVSGSYLLDELTVEVTATAGVAVAPEHATDGATLMRRADVALAHAKGTGRPVSVYQPSLEQRSLHKLRLVTGLREALESGQVVVRYQPKVDLRTRELVGVEALVRWNHPELGEVTPDEFVPLAEVTGLIGPLTMLVLGTSVNQVRTWLDRGLRIPVAVNLSARTLHDTEFPDRVAELLAARDVPAGMISFELTESSVMTDPDRMKPVLRRLHELGVELSVDDFGTGYSSLAQLRRLPVDEVKIDKEFVLGMGTDLGDLAIVRAIVDMGHSLGLRVVAEGVEDELARDLLAGSGCDVIQGYLVARPLSADVLDGWLSARTAPRPPQPGVDGRRLELTG